MKEIYNEGRVVGLSAYDLYVRQFLSTYPEDNPMSEREWLSKTLSENSSMILRIPAGTTAGYHDYLMPENCQLRGATVVYASVFDGEVSVDGSGYWAVRVDDYGELISNTHDRHPETPGTPEFVPAKVDPNPSSERLFNRCVEYGKIVQGLVIQPGDWDSLVYNPPLVPDPVEGDEFVEPIPERNLIPDLNVRGFVRLLISESIQEDVLIFMHGFMYSPFLKAETSHAAGSESPRPQDGDFLGPQIFPWSCPIVLLVTNDSRQADTHDIKVLKEHVDFLATLHSLRYTAQLTSDPDGVNIVTEDDEDIIAEEYGTVKDMWDHDGQPDEGVI